MSKLDRWIDQQNTHETPKPVDLSDYLTVTNGDARYLGKTAIATNSYRLGGVDANDYALKSDVPPEPTWRDWTPTLTGWSGTPIVTARYSVHGSTVHFVISVVGTSNSASALITLPTGLTAANIHVNHEWNGACQIATSTNQAAAGRWRIANNGSIIYVYKDWDDGTWATTGAKAVKLSGFYETAGGGGGGSIGLE